jgi:MFS family permease
VAAVAALAGPVEAVLAIAALTVLGTLAFAGTQPVRGWAVAGERRTRGAGAVAAPGIRTLVAATLLLGAAFGAAEVAMPAFTEEHGSREAGGIALAAYALGSMLGGLVVASLAPSPRLGQRFAVAVALVGMLLVPLAAAPSIAAVTALALVAGLPIAPAFAFSYRLVDRLAPPGTATEAFAWISTAIVAGVSAGAPLGGGAISAAGPHAAFLLAAACAGAAAVVAAARRGSLA